MMVMLKINGFAASATTTTTAANFTAANAG
jgi:hypothetical protein